MKKRIGLLFLAAIILSAFLFAGCGGTREIRFLTPDGGTLLPVAKLFTDNSEIEGKTVVGEAVSPVAVEARLFAKTCEAAVAPVNLCKKVYEDGAGAYQFAGVVTWGNNFIVATNTAVPTDTFLPTDLTGLYGEVVYAFGEASVPGATLKKVLTRNGADFTVLPTQDAAPAPDKINLFFAGAQGTDVRDAIMRPDSAVKYAMLPEPNVTALETAQKVTVVFDLQALWGEDSYPQAGLMIKTELAAQNPALVRALLQKVQASAAYCLENPAPTAALAVDTLQSASLPQKPVLEKYIAGRGAQIMRYADASDETVRTAVSEYLKELTGSEPNEGFYYS
jgi:ABC-type nitrate/sulfonate/bicarbonate transport system substrate-binding protein